jgi:hypothetical protein
VSEADFEITAWASGGKACNGDDLCEKIDTGETAIYTVRIINYLGTGKDFYLTNSHSPEDPNCKFYKDGSEIYDIFVKSDEVEEFTMECLPSQAGTYNIWIQADPSGYLPKGIDVKLILLDFELVVSPEELERLRGEEAKYNVKITNNIDVTTFTLSATCTDCSSDEVTCTIDSTLNVPIGGEDSTVMTCVSKSDCPEDEYKIEVTATAGGIFDSDSVYLKVKVKCECDGYNCKDENCEGCVRCPWGATGFICKDGVEIRDDLDVDRKCCIDDDCSQTFCSKNDPLSGFYYCYYDTTPTCDAETNICGWDNWEECGGDRGECRGFCEPTGCTLCKCGTGPDDKDVFCKADCTGCRVCSWSGTQPEHVCNEGDDVTNALTENWHELSINTGYIVGGRKKGCCLDTDCPDWYCFDRDGTGSIWECWIRASDDGSERIPQKCYNYVGPQPEVMWICDGYDYPIFYNSLDECRFGTLNEDGSRNLDSCFWIWTSTPEP